MAFSSSPNAPEEKRIILIGCTGHGKGSLGNFLYNLGQVIPGRYPPFGESARLNPDTQSPYSQCLDIENSPNAPEARKGKRYTILDTPGLNDIGRNTDLQHMISVLRMIRTQFYSVHMLVLVYRFKTRADAAISPALRYYRDLFSPLFRAQNVILVLTHVSSDDYELGLEDETWDTNIQNHLNQCNEILELNTPEWNCPIVMSYFVNTKWTNGRIEKLLQKIDAKREFERTDLLYRSYLMREQILNYVAEAHEITLDTHLVSLPPALETERKSALLVINGRISQLLDTVETENKLRAKQLTELEQLRTQLTEKRSLIEQWNVYITRLKAIQKTPATYVSGDDMFRLTSAGIYSVDAPCGQNSSGHSCNCRFKYEAHNASHPSNYPKIEKRTWKVRVNPDTFNFTKREDRYWYYRFWLEYDGTSHYGAEIATGAQTVFNLNVEIEGLERRLHVANDAAKTGEAKLATHNENLQKLNQDKSTLLSTPFLLEKVNNILSCMQEIMTVQQ